MDTIRLSFRVIVEAFYHFNRYNGWAIASHIALSTLMAMFPFLIVVTAIAGFIGSVNLANEVVSLLIAAWPREVVGRLDGEIHNVLTTSRGDLLTLGAVFAIYFSSSGVESLRIGLNRAYNETETRAWWLLRLESTAYVLVGAVSLSALAFLIVLAPLIQPTVLYYLPGLAGIEDIEKLVSPQYAIIAGAIAGRALYDGRLDAKAALALIAAAAFEGIAL